MNLEMILKNIFSSKVFKSTVKDKNQKWLKPCNDFNDIPIYNYLLFDFQSRIRNKYPNLVVH